MITKMRINPLNGFHDIKPGTNSNGKYTIKIDPTGIYLNKECFKHFKGSTDLKIACNADQKALAVINTYHDDPCLIHISIARGKQSNQYNRVSNKGLLHNINKLLPLLKKKSCHLIAKSNDIGKNYIIFRLKNKEA